MPGIGLVWKRLRLRSHLDDLNCGRNRSDSAQDSSIMAKCGTHLQCRYFLTAPQSQCNFAVIVEQQNALQLRKNRNVKRSWLCAIIWYMSFFGMYQMNGGTPKKCATKTHKKCGAACVAAACLGVNGALCGVTS